MMISLNQKDVGKHIVYSDGKVWSKKLKRFLKICTDARGYCYVSIDKKRYKRHHRLLAECFIPNPNNYDQVNHINGIRNDNRLENLEWCNASMNQKHAYKTGLRKPMPGEINHRHKLKNEDIPSVRKALSEGFKLSQIAFYFDVAITTISMIKRNQNWSSI